MGEKFASPVAVELLYNTGLVESKYHYLRQYPSGPARSFWQVETHSVIDNLINYLLFRVRLRNRCAAAALTDPAIWKVPPQDKREAWKVMWANIIESNLRAAIVHARLIYWRSPAALPKLNLQSQGEYWVQYYNRGGKGTVEKFVAACQGHESG